MLTSCLIMLFSVVAKTAVDSSICGVIIALRGASLDFAIISEQ